MITDKEINQVADDEKQKDWNDLKYADIYKDGFIDGAKWMQMRASQVKPEVKPACEPQIEKIFETESHSNTKTREYKQIIVGEFGTRIFIDWRKREFSITENQSKSV